jgi:hypothetical protein
MGRIKDWAKCLDCGARRLVRHKEWIRASRPRCLACGGPIEPSGKAADEHASHYDAEKDDRAKRDRKTGRDKVKPR